MSDIPISEAVKSLKLVNGLEEQVYIRHELNTSKIDNLDDCKKILKFLCDLSIKPQPKDIEYAGFSKVAQYFD